MNGSNLISSFYAQKEKLLRKSFANFTNSVKFFPHFGIELEFYLLDQNLQTLENQGLVDDYILELKNIFLKNSQIYNVEKEQGRGQIEIKIAPTSDLSRLCEDIEEIKKSAKNLANKNNLIASFAAQPFVDDCGSALQFNFSLHDENGENLFAKKDELFFQSIAGMLELLDEMMIFCAPKKEDYLRFDLEINRALHKKGKYTAPVNISFGDDNRTAAIRIPRVENVKQSRIEFRVAAADSDPYLMLVSLLSVVDYGIVQKLAIQDLQKVFGNAFDEQYAIKKFAKNLQEAQKYFLRDDGIIKKVII